MANAWVLLPEPQEVEWREGAFAPGRFLCMRVDRRAWAPLQSALMETSLRWKEVGFSLQVEPYEGEGEHLSIVVERPRSPLPELPEHEEGYCLAVDTGGISLAASSAHGLFNGLQTLSQLVEQARDRFPCALIRDWPALNLRGIHLDLKGAMAPVEYWIEVIQLLARFKINAVLIEYEDKFPFTSHPDIVGPGAFTAEELERLLTVARDHFVEVIPLLQCLGHVEYILRHPAYAELRESGQLTQFCPQQPASLRLWKELADEMIAAHPGIRRFHLGADEAWLLGDCPRCRQVVEERGKLALFLDHVNQAIAHVRGYGLQPIIWDDMIQRNLEENSLAALPEDVVLCDWFYRQRSPRAVSFFYGGSEGHARYRWASRQWEEIDPGVLEGEIHWLEEAPKPVLEFAKRYWDRGEYPLYGSSLPWVRFFIAQGRKVIGASAAKGADGFAAFCPMFGPRLDNVATWALGAKEEGAEGVISTAWSRYDGLTNPCEPFELGWYTYVASGAFYWEGRAPDRQTFDQQFTVAFLGKEDSAVPKALDWLDRGRQRGHYYLLRSAQRVFETCQDGATPFGRRYLEHLALAARLAWLQAEATQVFRNAWPRGARAWQGLLAVHHRERILNAVNASREALREWRNQAGPVLASTLLPADVREVIDTQCFAYERPLELLRAFIESTAPFQEDAS